MLLTAKFVCLRMVSPGQSLCYGMRWPFLTDSVYLFPGLVMLNMQAG